MKHTKTTKHTLNILLLAWVIGYLKKGGRVPTVLQSHLDISVSPINKPDLFSPQGLTLGN